MVENRSRRVVSVLGFLFLMMWIKIGVVREQIESFSESESEPEDVEEVDIEIRNYFNKTLQGKGVILSWKGGIGNQLFQYACSYALASERECPLYNFVYGNGNASLHHPRSRKFLPDHRDYALDNFQIPLNNFIDKTTIINPTELAYVNDSQLLYGNYFNKSFLQLTSISYCQSQAYWAPYKDEIMSMFQLKPEVIQEFPPYVTWLEKEIERSPESVAVHVRRGDFVLIDGFDVPISYQKAAIHRIIEILQERRDNGTSISPPKFFVFSDDIEYARSNLEDFSELYEFVFVSYFPDGVGNRTTSLQDFYLMTKCKHFIIPNSTFAWWAAYLSTNWKDWRFSKSEQIVIASAFNPKFWKLWKNKEEQKFYEMLHGQLYHPKEWIIIDTFHGDHR